MADELNSITIQRPKRWDVPFWKEPCESGVVNEMNGAAVDRLMAVPLFKHMDLSRFPEHMSLQDVLLNDSRIRRMSRGEIIVRQGDYGNSAFLILSGSVQVLIGTVDETLFGRYAPQRKSFFKALSQLWNNPRQPEVRNLSGNTAASISEIDSRNRRVQKPAIFLQDIPAVIKNAKNVVIPAGELFGEIAALGRTPRTSTVLAHDDCELLEIRWQGLRELRLRSRELKDYVDRLYRERSLKSHLRETPMFMHLGDKELERVAAATEFQTYGAFDWHTSYKKIAEMGPTERLQFEPVVVKEGHYPNGVYLVRSGFARISETYNHGERTVSYLGRGQAFGLEEIAYNWNNDRPIQFRRTMRAVGYIDVLFVPTHVVEETVLTALPEDEITQLRKSFGEKEKHHSLPDAAEKIDPAMIEFMVEKRFINGTATMFIDLDRCTRCDDCVRACASVHNNNPRFMRYGPVHSSFMVAHACMHCQDPVCMIGCPTGAIHRADVGGQVVINDRTCIGCSTCANSCPYENIQMVFARDEHGNPYYDQTTHAPIQKATKCDLCVDQMTGPACANACPHDAMIRMDARNLDRLSTWFHR